LVGVLGQACTNDVRLSVLLSDERRKMWNLLSPKTYRSQPSTSITSPCSGALIVSLDFELYSGVSDLYRPPSAYDENVLGTRSVIPALLSLFEEFGISATWAIVGMLFAQNTSEMKAFCPDRLPSYKDPRLSSYSQVLDSHEREAPFYFAPDLIKQIAGYPAQEIATHTFGHYYCLEPDQVLEEFEADLTAARRIAEQHKFTLRSIVFPRNQINQAYLSVLLRHGIWAYRGNEAKWMNKTGPRSEQAKASRRIARLADAYVNISGDKALPWKDVRAPGGLCNVQGSRYFRSYSRSLSAFETRRLNRVVGEIESAARSGRLYHLWLHPEDFGRYIPENLHAMRIVLESFRNCRKKYGMQSLCMRQVAETVNPSLRLGDLHTKNSTT
jgi:peptidoglycan/xylan/chitin deacetylase (PgdA/CDA1 family)